MLVNKKWFPLWIIAVACGYLLLFNSGYSQLYIIVISIVGSLFRTGKKVWLKGIQVHETFALKSIIPLLLMIVFYYIAAWLRK